MLSDVLKSVSSAELLSEFFPRLRPNKFVVGVPVTIHLRSALMSFRKWLRLVDSEAALCPSSRTRRFHLTCKSVETPFGVEQ